MAAETIYFDSWASVGRAEVPVLVHATRTSAEPKNGAAEEIEIDFCRSKQHDLLDCCDADMDRLKDRAAELFRERDEKYRDRIEAERENRWDSNRER